MLYSMDLSANVRQFYLDHFRQLPEDKQFHFASRLSAWNGDVECKKLLEDIRARFITEDIGDSLKSLMLQPPEARINAAQLRQSYFDKFPGIRGKMLALFRVRHLKYIFDVDTSQELLQLIPLDDLYSLSSALARDPDSMRVLSTYAINCLYLIEHILFPRAGIEIDLSSILDHKSGYDLQKPEEIQLFIYLYTHCIIGESNFYERAVLPARKQAYLRMLSEMESVINDKYELIHLDNKLEFLVCCRIIGYETRLSNRVHQECAESISSDGNFLIDTLNNFKQSHKTTFADSEHRNVLFIMSTSPYNK